MPYRSRAFHQGLNETGYVEGRNVAIEYRWAESQIRSTAGIGGRSGSPTGGRDCRDQHSCGTRGKGGDHDDSDRVRDGADPVAAGLVASLNRPGGNVTGVTPFERRAGAKATGAAARVDPHGDCHCAARQPDQSQCRDPIERSAGGGPHPRAAAPCPACEHRTRLRYGIRNLRPTASRRARDRPRCILQ